MTISDNPSAKRASPPSLSTIATSAVPAGSRAKCSPSLASARTTAPSSAGHVNNPTSTLVRSSLGARPSPACKGNTSIEPARVGVRPGHHEHVADVVRLDVAGSLVAPPDPLEPSVPFQANNLGTGPQHDRWRLFDPANEIAGHGVRQSIFPD